MNDFNPNDENRDRQTFLLGKLTVNLQSLELLVRVFLMKQANQTEAGLDGRLNESVEITHLTSYDTMGQLFEKYNAIAMVSGSACAIDKTAIVDVRDTLAHGRITTLDPSLPLRVVRYSKPNRGDTTVKIIADVTMTDEWFAIETDRVHDAMVKVAKLGGILNLGISG